MYALTHKAHPHTHTVPRRLPACVCLCSCEPNSLANVPSCGTSHFSGSMERADGRGPMSLVGLLVSDPGTTTTTPALWLVNMFLLMVQLTRTKELIINHTWANQGVCRIVVFLNSWMWLKQEAGTHIDTLQYSSEPHVTQFVYKSLSLSFSLSLSLSRSLSLALSLSLSLSPPHLSLALKPFEVKRIKALVIWIQMSRHGWVLCPWGDA